MFLKLYRSRIRNLICAWDISSTSPNLTKIKCMSSTMVISRVRSLTQWWKSRSTITRRSFSRFWPRLSTSITTREVRIRANCIYLTHLLTRKKILRMKITSCLNYRLMFCRMTTLNSWVWSSRSILLYTMALIQQLSTICCGYRDWPWVWGYLFDG